MNASVLLLLPAVILCAATALPAFGADRVKTANGMIESTVPPEGRRSQLQGDSLRAAARRRPALARTAAGEELAGRAQRRQVRRHLHAAALPERGLLVPRRRHERGLPLPERLDAREVGPREAAGARLHLRRRIPERRRLRAALRRREHGPQGHRRGVVELPHEHLRLLRASGADEGVAAPRLGQLRPARPGGGAAVGAAEHRRIRRRPGAGDHRRRIGGIDFRQRADGVSALERPDGRRDLRKRRGDCQPASAAARRSGAERREVRRRRRGGLARRASRHDRAAAPGRRRQGAGHPLQHGDGRVLPLEVADGDRAGRRAGQGPAARGVEHRGAGTACGAGGRRPHAGDARRRRSGSSTATRPNRC